MNKKSLAIVLAMSLALTVFALAGGAQTKPVTTAAATTVAAPAAPLDLLPPSDLVAFAHVKRLITEAAPKAFADDPAKLAEFNAELDGFKAKTGIDARAFDSVAVGMRYQNPTPGVTTADTVFIAQGTFNAGALIAAGRVAAKGKYQEQKYKDSTIYVFAVNDHVNVPGLMNMSVREMAVTTLDANTLVFGELPAVRATLDARSGLTGATRANADLVQLAQRSPNALMGFSANVPPSLSKSVNIPNDEISRLLGSIRQAYGSVGTTANGFGLLAVARTEKADDAQSLSDTLSALKQFGVVVAGQLPADQRDLAQRALDSMKSSAAGNETSVSFELQQSDISTLLRVLKPKKTEATEVQKPGAGSQNQ
ncbi:MAG TPA: hypothetical protein VD861_13340 [Pyrinomonadaceae bacterium]|nr:hypothetical protein [Pyrinomonadaceae bacterium]